MNDYDVIIIGAGAAGLMCAGIANKRGRKILLIEHTDNIGEKIRISGGGRCNFTNTHTTYKNYLSENPDFVRNFLDKYTPNDFINLVNKHKISYHEKTLGQLFCDDSSKQIINMLISETKPNTQIINNCKINDIIKTDMFHISTSTGLYRSKSLVIATGGLSIPKIGATGFAYDVAQKFQVKINKIRPALVPLICNNTSSIAGVAVNSITKYENIEFAENMLFTHKGLSGPSILQISSYLIDHNESYIELDFMPNINMKDILLKNKETKLFLHNVLKSYLPNRFVEHYFPENKKLAEYKNKDIEIIANKINHYKILINGTESYNKAEVTAGGIDTNELSGDDLEVKNIKNLYFIGESIDVTGWLGGYNFQWAWSCGYATGSVV